jgi:hypothetical protein
MASLLCAHCKRRIFLRQQQLPPISGLCVPCGHQDAERRSADSAWRRFRDGLVQPAKAPPIRPPLSPAADLRHL